MLYMQGRIFATTKGNARIAIANRVKVDGLTLAEEVKFPSADGDCIKIVEARVQPREDMTWWEWTACVKQQTGMRRAWEIFKREAKKAIDNAAMAIINTFTGKAYQAGKKSRGGK